MFYPVCNSGTVLYLIIGNLSFSFPCFFDVLQSAPTLPSLPHTPLIKFPREDPDLDVVLNQCNHIDFSNHYWSGEEGGEGNWTLGSEISASLPTVCLQYTYASQRKISPLCICFISLSAAEECSWLPQYYQSKKLGWV